MTTRWRIDRLALRIAVCSKTELEGMSVRKAAELAGVSTHAIHSAQHERPLSAENLLAIARWLRIDPFTLLSDTATP